MPDIGVKCPEFAGKGDSAVCPDLSGRMRPARATHSARATRFISLSDRLPELSNLKVRIDARPVRGVDALLLGRQYDFGMA